MIKLNLGRNCLKVIIRTYGIKEIFIPYYSCKTLWQAAKEENCKVKFYHIDEHFMPACDFRDDSFILYINYFGLFENNCKILSEKYKNLITDNTHAFYSGNYGIATFNSLRKFFPVQNGAYFWLNKEPQINFYNDDINLQVTNPSDNYEQFKKNELKLDKEPVKLISHKVEQQMENIDFDKDKKLRISTFKKYSEIFDEYNLIKLPELNGNIPYCYPLCTKNNDILNKLDNSDLVIIRLWDDLPQHFNENSFLFNVAALPLTNYCFKILNTDH